jgi:hypothetical protein
MAEVSDPNNVWVLKEERIGGQEEKWAENADGMKVCVQEAVEGKLRITPIPPRKVNSNFGAITERSTTPEPTQSVTQEPEKKLVASGDPVYGMMQAAKKFPTPVEVEISIMLPKKSLFEVANESFEDGGKKVVEYIIENLDISDLKDALRRSLYEAYGQSLQEESEELTTEELLLDQPVIEKDDSERIEEISGKLGAQITVESESVLTETPEPVPVIEGEPEAVEEPIIGEPVAGIPAS